MGLLSMTQNSSIKKKNPETCRKYIIVNDHNDKICKTI